MRKVFFIIALCVGMVACNGGKPTNTTDEIERVDVVEVILFHGAQSCASCKAIERTVDEVITEYKEAVDSGSLIYSNLDLIEHEARAKKYGVVWSSLLVIEYDSEGNERITDLTDYAYTDVMTDSNKLKRRLSTAIDNYLNE